MNNGTPRAEKYISIIILCFTLLFSGCHSGGGSDKVAYETDSRILGEFVNLETHLENVDGTDYPELDPLALFGLVSEAREAYVDGDLCYAAELMADFLEDVQNSRLGSSTAVAEDLFNRAWSVRYNMLIESPGGTACSGFDDLGQVPMVTVNVSDNESFQGTILFGSPRFVTVEDGEEGEDSETYSQVYLPGVPVWTSGEGLPDIPMFRRLIAVPRGATAEISATATPGPLLNMNLYPSQPPRSDLGEEGAENPPFTVDETVYGEDALFPAYACTLLPVGPYRDLELMQIECAAAQYNPVSDTLQLFDGVDFAVSFTGGTGAFITSTAQSPFDHTKNVIPSLLNGDVVDLYVEESETTLLDTGEEFLIITTPEFRDAALDLAQWKSEKGILTRVFDLDQITDIMGAAGSDRDVIDTFIEERYDSGIIRPSYILLLGSYDRIPVYDTPTHSFYDDNDDYHEYQWWTDYGYADYRGSVLPFFALGRVRVNSLEQAQYYVDKVIRYESDPPEDPDFYQKAMVAGHFQTGREKNCPDADGNNAEICGQTERWFIESVEFAEKFLRDSGYDVNRAYDAKGDSTPTWYYYGSLLPADIGYGSDFPWAASAEDIVAAINEGRFLVTHRDHGDRMGWSRPNFRSQDVLDLENGDLQSVVLAINCFSGRDYFLDVWLVQNQVDPAASTGGAVGVLAATRITYSGYNDDLYRGLLDSIWPTALPYFGDLSASPQPLGAMHLHAKLYLSSLYSAEEDKYLEATIQGHQTWGDPTLQMWTKKPDWEPLDYLIESSDTNSLSINYEEIGAVVTAYQETEDGHRPLGRSRIVEGSATIHYIQEPLPNVPILLGASGVNAVGVLLTPAIKASTSSLSFGSEETELDITITNAGGGILEWSLPALPGWLTVSAVEGELAAGEAEIISIMVDRTWLADGSFEYDLTFDTNVLNVESETLVVSVSMAVASGIMTFPILKTGLNVSYDEDGNIDSGLLDDGHWQYGSNFSYAENGDGSVTDQVTGLRWMQNGSDSELTYSGAQSYCSAVTLDGGGWRIPNVYEYYTILNFSQSNPALDHSFFSSLSGYYWTTTQMADSSSSVWSIREPYADDGINSLISGSRYVRCVKGDVLAPSVTGRFSDNGTGTVLDNWTGLVWEAASSNGTTGYTWEEALSHCEAKSTLGRAWHLPNVKQMQSLLKKNVAAPAIDTGFFTSNSYTLWTSSTDAYTNGGSMELSWAVSEGGYGDFVLAGVFKTSIADDNGRPMGVRCVSW